MFLDVQNQFVPQRPHGAFGTFRRSRPSVSVASVIKPKVVIKVISCRSAATLKVTSTSKAVLQLEQWHASTQKRWMPSDAASESTSGNSTHVKL
ncbi:MAG: hypothetical protein FRX49_02579 [Trebouxia sp. A1-2]|nr:MAG: hypothetical protein FRX49_02579 [Trebouxia sp. A1-2]